MVRATLRLSDSNYTKIKGKIAKNTLVIHKNFCYPSKENGGVVKDFLLLLLMIFPWLWIGITFWTMKTKNTQHWLYKSWLWLHWFLLSFVFVFNMTIPIMIIFSGVFLIPLSIWGLSRLLKALGINNAKVYTRYNIIFSILMVIVTLSTAKSIENDEPGILSMIFVVVYMILSLFFVCKLCHSYNAVESDEDFSYKGIQTQGNMLFPEGVLDRITYLKRRFVIVTCMIILFLIILWLGRIIEGGKSIGGLLLFFIFLLVEILILPWLYLMNSIKRLHGLGRNDWWILLIMPRFVNDLELMWKESENKLENNNDN